MRFPRAWFGYRPGAVRAAWARIEEHYRQIADELTAQMAHPAAGPASVFGLERLKLEAPRPRIPMMPFGYQVQAVEAALAELHRLWRADLEWLAAELTRREADMYAALMSPGQAGASVAAKEASVVVAETPVVAEERPAVVEDTPVAEVPPQPVEAPPAPRPASRVVPLRRRSEVAEAAPARPRPLGAWRPGLIEEYDGVYETAPAPQPRPAETARLALNRAPAPSTRAGMPEPGTAPAASSQSTPAPLPMPAAVPIPAQVPAAQAAPGLDAQVQQGLAGRLELLFQRFLVGKAVGVDMVLPTGQVLASRGALITRELVQQAEEAGLLPVLIANMTIPGMTE